MERLSGRIAKRGGEGGRLRETNERTRREREGRSRGGGGVSDAQKHRHGMNQCMFCQGFLFRNSLNHVNEASYNYDGYLTTLNELPFDRIPIVMCAKICYSEAVSNSVCVEILQVDQTLPTQQHSSRTTAAAVRALHIQFKSKITGCSTNVR